MDTAIVWYQSRALWAMLAALLLAAAAHFGISLPEGWDKDKIAGFLLQSVLIIVAIVERIKSTKVIAATPQKAADINATTVVTSVSGTSPISPTAGSTSTLVALILIAPLVGILLSLSACATIGVRTAAQGLFAAYSTYDVALTVANTYAHQPGANASIVHLMATTNAGAKPATELVVAYRTCVTGGSASVTVHGVVIACSTYDFSATGLQNAATTLRNAALSLQGITPAQ